MRHEFVYITYNVEMAKIIQLLHFLIEGQTRKYFEWLRDLRRRKPYNTQRSVVRNNEMSNNQNQPNEQVCFWRAATFHFVINILLSMSNFPKIDDWQIEGIDDGRMIQEIDHISRRASSSESLNEVDDGIINNEYGNIYADEDSENEVVSKLMLTP